MAMSRKAEMTITNGHRTTQARENVYDLCDGDKLRSALHKRVNGWSANVGERQSSQQSDYTC
jgi:hypothetical protein